MTFRSLLVKTAGILLALTTAGLGVTFLAPPLCALFGDGSAQLAGIRGNSLPSSVR